MTKILAFALKNDELKHWIALEQGGYGPEDDVPAYRLFRVPLSGNLNDGIRFLENQSLPVGHLTREQREVICCLKCTESLAAIEELLSSSKDEFYNPLPDAMPHFNGVFNDMACTSVRRVVGKHLFARVKDAVGNKLLDFILELADACPEANLIESGLVASPEVSKASQQLFNMVVTGNNNFISGGTIGNTMVIPGNRESLVTALSQMGIESRKLDTLQEILESEPAPKGNGYLGPRTTAWLKSIKESAVTTSCKVAGETAARSIFELLKQFHASSDIQWPF